MAAWHVDFHVIPRSVVAAGRHDTDGWKTAPFLADYRQRLAGVAPLASAEGTNPETWGSEEGNRVDVWTDAGRVARVTVRVDVRRLDSRFGAALIGFVRAAGAVLVRTDGLVVEPIISAYAGALRNSEAWKKFGGDAASFL